MSVKVNLALALYRARTERHLTQAQAAEIFDCSIRWYQKIESGRSEPNLLMLCKIAKFFCVDIASLTDEEMPYYV